MSKNVVRLNVQVCYIITFFHRTRAVKNSWYSENAIIRIKCPPEITFKDAYEYAEIQSIHFVIDNQKIFCCHLRKILENVDHMISLCVSQTDTKVLLTCSDMFCHGVLHLKSVHEKVYLIEKKRMYS